MLRLWVCTSFEMIAEVFADCGKKLFDWKIVEILFQFDKQIVTSSICQSAVLPSSNPEQPSIITQPESLGDVLLNVSSDPKPMNMLDKMKKAKFDPPENPYDDTYFTFYSERSSSACKQGRYTIVILRYV